MRVATNQRIERPHDAIHAPLASPRPLMTLEREPDAISLLARDDSCDVRVQVYVATRRADHCDRGTDDDVTPSRRDDVAA